MFQAFHLLKSSLTTASLPSSFSERLWAFHLKNIQSHLSNGFLQQVDKRAEIDTTQRCINHLSKSQPKLTKIEPDRIGFSCNWCTVSNQGNQPKKRNLPNQWEKFSCQISSRFVSLPLKGHPDASQKHRTRSGPISRGQGPYHHRTRSVQQIDHPKQKPKLGGKWPQKMK